MRRTELRLHEIDIWEDPGTAARVRSVAHGNETVPTVFVNGEGMVNPSVREVLAAASGGQPPARWWRR
ncbi:glutaredoxin domain-containing protein [Nocardia terpenica]|uniref:glutaredoxin domain-containing protein n=1 Tax=Nocardia terpenica TaxID=455432 RepID=UPI0020A65107|nr:glutaredoxin domain-containing protein [Nocardia terpenica]